MVNDCEGDARAVALCFVSVFSSAFRLAVELKFLLGTGTAGDSARCQFDMRMLLRGVTTDHLPLLARSALPVASKRMTSISVPMDHYQTMTVIRYRWLRKLKLEINNSGPGKRVAGVYASRCASLLACDHSSVFIEDDYQNGFTNAN